MQLFLIQKLSSVILSLTGGLELIKYSRNVQAWPCGPLGWLGSIRQDQSSTKKYLTPKQLCIFPRSEAKLDVFGEFVQKNLHS